MPTPQVDKVGHHFRSDRYYHFRLSGKYLDGVTAVAVSDSNNDVQWGQATIKSATSAELRFEATPKYTQHHHGPGDGSLTITLTANGNQVPVDGGLTYYTAKDT
jgi:hypothetical protein